MNVTRVCTLASACLLFACGGKKAEPPFEFKGTIYVKGLADMSGQGKAVGQPYQYGIYDLARELNEQQGIGGYKVDFEWIDYGYDVQNAVNAYYAWRTQPEWANVSAVMGYGTADTTQLRDEAIEDQKPYLSSSYSARFTSPEGKMTTVTLPDGTMKTFNNAAAPYNFFVSSDYSTSIRIAMNFIKKKGGTKVAFAFCSTTAFCYEPPSVGKIYADSIGLNIAKTDLGIEQNIATENTPAQIEQKVADFLAVPENAGTDWVWVGNSRASTNWVVKAFAKLAPNVKLVSNVWGFDEEVFGECGTDCVGREYGVSSFASYGDLRYAAMEEVVRIHDKWREADMMEKTLHANTKYVMGHVAFYTLAQAAEAVIADGNEPTGVNIKAKLESFVNHEIGGLTPPLTYKSTDHRPINTNRIYSINSSGKLQFEEESSVDLKAEWVGW